MIFSDFYRDEADCIRPNLGGDGIAVFFDWKMLTGDTFAGHLWCLYRARYWGGSREKFPHQIFIARYSLFRRSPSYLVDDYSKLEYWLEFCHSPSDFYYFIQQEGNGSVKIIEDCSFDTLQKVFNNRCANYKAKLWLGGERWGRGH